MKKIISAILCISAMFFIKCKNDDSSEETSQTISFDVTAIDIKNTDSKSPKKGDKIVLEITIRNSGNSDGNVTIEPKLSSSRFSDYKNVTIDAVQESLTAGETKTVNIEIGPFIFDAFKGKHYALGTGEYFIESVKLNEDIDTNFNGGLFNVSASNVVFVPVLFDPSYLSKIGVQAGIDSYLTSAFSRKVELYDNNGQYIEYSGGMDEMMDIKQMFYPMVTSNPTEYGVEDGRCEKAVALAKVTLGLANNWEGPVGTQVNNHGFDYLMALSPESFGGVACGWINVQVTGVFDFDLSLERSQILVIHETGHILGSPHCDPLQGYVMCAGEKHQKYNNEGTYVFNISSRNQMSNRFD